MGHVAESAAMSHWHPRHAISPSRLAEA